ncbi:MAG: hypothetical protein M3437_10455 [Chloroflexota bacterium]|nr:hypothetical protein [Chloroflexota bacterium]MDQ5864610.1 hypothetical protein [Chloroflexota bacterium]
MDVSPDHKSLAVIIREPCTVEKKPTPAAGDEPGMPPAGGSCEGGTRSYLYTVSLANNTVRSVPDYSNSYEDYRTFFFVPPQEIVGWVDNNRIAVQLAAVPTRQLVLAEKDGSSYKGLDFPTGYATAGDASLSPDRKTLFSAVVGDGKIDSGFWLYNLEGSNPRKLADLSQVKWADKPAWSPNGKHISFISPKGGSDYKHMSVSILDLDTLSLQDVTAPDTSSSAPVWSPDSSQIAFLQADDPENARNGKYKEVDSNLFVADANSKKPRKLTAFSKKRNRDVQWTSDGNLLLTSTALSADASLELVSIQAKDGKAVKLSKKSSTNSPENVVLPVIFK